MNEAEISQSITQTFEGVDVVIDSGNSFFFYSPDKNVPWDRYFPLGAHDWGKCFCLRAKAAHP